MPVAHRSLSNLSDLPTLSYWLAILRHGHLATVIKSLLCMGM